MMRKYSMQMNDMTEPNKEGVSPKPDYCDCGFVMIMRGKDDIAYCSECKKEVDELLEQDELRDLKHRLKAANEYLERNGMPTF